MANAYKCDRRGKLFEREKTPNVHNEKMRNKILELEEDLKIKDIETEAELIEYMAKFFDVPITLISPTNKEESKLFDKQWENIEKRAIEVTKKALKEREEE